MSKNKITTTVNTELNLIEVKSKFDAEFRRWSFKRNDEPQNFEQFYALIERLHKLSNIQFLIMYIDPSDNDLLPINNDDNFGRALKIARPLLRIIVQRKGELEEFQGYGTLKPNHNNPFGIFLKTPVKSKPTISQPLDFHQVSAIIDVDIVPETHRRVRLLKHGSDKPLGFYIRDGISLRPTSSNGYEKQPGIFISRLVAGGLAESTGLLAVNDEVIEVNGIEVAGKTLDQVTDMMVANSSNLIITVKPANQRLLTTPRRGSFSRNSQLSSGSHQTNNTNTSDENEQDDQDEIVDLTGMTLDTDQHQQQQHSNSTVLNIGGPSGSTGSRSDSASASGNGSNNNNSAFNNNNNSNNTNNNNNNNSSVASNLVNNLSGGGGGSATTTASAYVVVSSSGSTTATITPPNHPEANKDGILHL